MVGTDVVLLADGIGIVVMVAAICVFVGVGLGVILVATAVTVGFVVDAGWGPFHNDKHAVISRRLGGEFTTMKRNIKKIIER